MNKKLGLYLHIPFCWSKCDYCDFYSVAGGAQWMDPYVKALLRHVREVAPQAKNYEVDTIYFGGGTPSFLGDKRLRTVLTEVRRRFQISPEAEITLEANPDTVYLPMLQQLRRAGFNRISLGVQSACDDQLADLKRPHTFSQAKEAVEFARVAGFDNISVDMMFGLPGQKMADWQESLQKALELEPDHVSCYSLKVEEGTPLHARQSVAKLPSDDEQADMYLWAVEQLQAKGWEQYEISNFARPGKASRHNLKYWRLEEYIGLGVAAHSDFGNRRYACVRDLQQYLEGMLAGDTILSESEDIPPRTRSGEYLMLRLRTVEGIAPQEYRNRYFMNFAPIENVLRTYQARGWADLHEGRWRFTTQGFLISNPLIARLLEVQEEATVQDILPRRPKRGGLV